MKILEAGGQAGGSQCMGAKEGKGYQEGSEGLHLLYGSNDE